MAADDLQARFSRYYTGRHDPRDALWWLEHPDTVGPSSATPPHQILDEAAAELDRAGQPGTAEALRTVQRAVRELDERNGRFALIAAQAELDLEADPNRRSRSPRPDPP